MITFLMSRFVHVLIMMSFVQVLIIRLTSIQIGAQQFINVRALCLAPIEVGGGGTNFVLLSARCHCSVTNNLDRFYGFYWTQVYLWSIPDIFHISLPAQSLVQFFSMQTHVDCD